MRLFGNKPPFTKRVEINPPTPLADRQGIAIVSHIKNEESYIAEWVLYHLAVGIRHFIIYENGSTDRTVEILRTILPAEKLTLIPWVFGLRDVRSGDLINSQVVAFSHAILNFGQAFRWMAFIDVDEFLLPTSGTTVEEALK